MRSMTQTRLRTRAALASMVLVCITGVHPLYAQPLEGREEATSYDGSHPDSEFAEEDEIFEDDSCPNTMEALVLAESDELMAIRAKEKAELDGLKGQADHVLKSKDSAMMQATAAALTQDPSTLKDVDPDQFREQITDERSKVQKLIEHTQYLKTKYDQERQAVAEKYAPCRAQLLEK